MSPKNAGEFSSLDVAITKLIPHTGIWKRYSKGEVSPFNPAFNDTIPTPQGEASNYIYSIVDSNISTHVAHMWMEDLPISGIGKLAVD